MRKHFADDLRHRLIGVTPSITRADWAQIDGEPLPVRFEREAEIRRWLHESGQPWRAWAALDDQAWRFRPICRQLVVCDTQIGMTEQEIELIDIILTGAPGAVGC